jgi:MFS family permease
MSVTRRVAVVGVVVISVVLAIAAAMTLAEKIVPDESARFPGHPESNVWISLLTVAHILGGMLGGCLLAVIGDRDTWREAKYSCLLLFLILGVPAISAFDRPVAMSWMLGFNVVVIVSLLCSVNIMRKWILNFDE